MIGLALGLVGASAATRIISSLLYDVSPTDAATFACVALLLAGVTLLALIAAFSAALLPWQAHHRFLGTTNYASYDVHAFHGAGFNLSFFAFLVAVGMPWLFVWPGRYRLPVLGSVGLLLPCVMIEQVALEICVLAYAVVAMMFMVYAATGTRLRARLKWRAGAFRRRWWLWLCPFLVSALVSCLWYVWARHAAADEVSLRISTLAKRMANPLALGLMGMVLLLVACGCVLGFRRMSDGLREEVGRLLSSCSGWRGAVVLSLLAMVMVLAFLWADGRGRADGGVHTGPVMQRLSRVLERDRVRGPMWLLGVAAIAETPMLGHGAGTWARYQKSQPRPYRAYYAHMHNTYLDLAFEYGLPVMCAMAGVSLALLFRLLFTAGATNRLWVLYLCGVAVMALGQHLAYAFTTLCLLIPVFVLLPRGLSAQRDGADG